MTAYVNEIVDRIRKFFMYKNRVPNPIQFTTIDHKYYIRNKLGKTVVWIVVEYGNPVETTTNTFTGSLEDCKSYLRTIGYRDNEILKTE